MCSSSLCMGCTRGCDDSVAKGDKKGKRQKPEDKREKGDNERRTGPELTTPAPLR